MQSISEIRALLEQYGLRPRHRFGQNFLHDKNQLSKLLEASAVGPGDVVLEVGPGTGTLTEALLERGATVIAAEIDRDLVQLLSDRFGDRITLIAGDCLDKRTLARPIVEALAGRPFTLVANLPYQVASGLIVALLLEQPQCMSQHVTIQKEVADRLTAGPSTKAYGPLGIIVQALADVQLFATVKPSSFWPMPEVTSAMVSIVPRDGADLGISIDDRHAFARFVTTLFTKRRKQLGAIFGRDVPLPCDPAKRPEALGVGEIVELWRALGVEQ